MDLNLRELVPGGIFVGTSLILRQGDRFLYGIRPAREEGGRPILELTGIGGGLEGRDRPLLIWLKPAHIPQTARDDIPLGEMLNAGVELITGDRGTPPPDSWTRLTDSQEALALALGDGAPAFYSSVGAR